MKPSEEPSSSETPAEAAALKALRDVGLGQHGCKHYRRRVRFITPCCGEEWWCRHCHNEVKYQQEEDWKKKHELDRKQITEVVCALCETRQPVDDHCNACGVSFGAYGCTQCPFFDDDLSKQPFHCPDCGICRIGGRTNYFHCPTCSSCYCTNLQGNHKCVERAMHQNCPVCFEFLFESVDPTTVLLCGHTIHTQCLKDLEEAQSGVCPQCPICKKSLGDYSRYWRAIDAQVAASSVPAEYRGWRADILCNDCSETANVPFHIVGLRCPGCGSYNTRRMAVQTRDGEAGAAAAAADPGGGEGGAGDVAQHLMDALLGIGIHFGQQAVISDGEEGEEEGDEGDGGDEDWEEEEEGEEGDGGAGDAVALAEAEALVAGEHAFGAQHGGGGPEPGGGPAADPMPVEALAGPHGLAGAAAAHAPPGQQQQQQQAGAAGGGGGQGPT